MLIPSLRCASTCSHSPLQGTGLASSFCSERGTERTPGHSGFPLNRPQRLALITELILFHCTVGLAAGFFSWSVSPLSVNVFFIFLLSATCLPLSIFPSAYLYKLHTGVYIVNVLIHLPEIASLSPLHCWVLLSEADRKVCVLYECVLCMPGVSKQELSAALVRTKCVCVYTMRTPCSQGVCRCYTNRR